MCCFGSCELLGLSKFMLLLLHFVRGYSVSARVRWYRSLSMQVCAQFVVACVIATIVVFGQIVPIAE